MNLRQLEAFRAAVAHGSFTRAAEAMGVSQPAVTRLIADLEAAVGFRLFDRGVGGAVPSPEAAMLHEELERSYLGLARLSQVAREIRDLRRGHVRVAAMPAVASMMAPTVIARFVAAHPEVRVTLDGHTAPRVLDLTAAGEFHLGFAHCPQPRADLTVLAQYRLDCVVVLPPSHALAAAEAIGPGDLDGVGLVALSHHTVTAGHVDTVFAEAGVTPAIRVECQPSYAACALVAQGVGVAIVDPLTPQVFGPETLAVRPFRPAVPFDFAVVRPEAGAIPAAAEAFAATAIDQLDARPEMRRQAPADGAPAAGPRS
jgi:DNA-binding transcriptional LysR family regulator